MRQVFRCLTYFLVFKTYYVFLPRFIMGRENFVFYMSILHFWSSMLVNNCTFIVSTKRKERKIIIYAVNILHA